MPLIAPLFAGKPSFDRIAEGAVQLRPGDESDEVGTVQVCLHLLNYSSRRRNFDQRFDSAMAVSVTNFRIEHGLADGFTSEAGPVWDGAAMHALDARFSARVHRRLLDAQPVRGCSFRVPVVDVLGPDIASWVVADHTLCLASHQAVAGALERFPEVFAVGDFDEMALETGFKEVWLPVAGYRTALTWIQGK